MINYTDIAAKSPEPVTYRTNTILSSLLINHRNLN